MENIGNDLKLQDLQLHCRTCLNLFSGQRLHKLQDMPSALFKLLGYAGLEMPQKEVFPSSICEICYEIIKSFAELQTKLKQSTKCLEELLKLQKTRINQESEELEDYEDNSKKFEADPLRENEDFESILVKVEMAQATSEEEETNKDAGEDELPSNVSIVELMKKETQAAYESAQARIFVSETQANKKSENAQIVCKYGCGKKFRRTHNAKAHYRYKHKHMESKNVTEEEHTGNDELKKCNISKPIAESTEITAEANSSATVFKATCNVCFKNFSTLAGLRSHKTTHQEVRPFQCDQCNRGFNMKARLKRHMREIHEENPPEIPCKYGCGKMFTRHESAMNHYRVKHILPEKGIVPKTNTYICEDCGKTFKTMHNLKEHSYTHRPNEERPFQCEQCQKRFISKRPYEIHLLRHAGIKNFECKICGLKTTTHNELRNHMNHHTKAKQVNCPICSKTYTSPDNLRRHTLIVHQGVKNYKCRFCELKFGKPDHLKHHEMRHTGERPHKCQICERGFIQLVALKAHMKTHNKATNSTEKEII